MGYLIDTNVLSELRKGSKMDKNVRDWFDTVPADDIYIIDGLMAATAMVHGHVLVARNVRDIEQTGVNFINPFNQS